MATFVQWHFQSAESKETTAKLALNEKQESNERKRKAKIHLKMAAHAVGKAQLKQESNERKRKAKIHLKMAAHAVGKANARAFDR